jgi:hypothetical protein
VPQLSQNSPSNAGDDALAQQCARDAVQELAAALAVLHGPGERDRFRELLERAIATAQRALAAAGDRAPELARGYRAEHDDLRCRMLVMLARAHAVKAEDALHGAGQLSLSAQRAPTREACNDGWQRVEAIVVGAETSAGLATEIVAELERDAPTAKITRQVQAAARRAEAAGRAARKLVAERNHAYTFHTDRRFSFGEGWYVAAAAVLAGVAIQIEPHQVATPEAEQFLLEAGLGDALQPYRSRPRAMKQTTALVARAFRPDPAAAQRRLRAAFLGQAPISPEVSAWVDARLASAPASPRRKKVLVWIRDGVHHAGRNTAFSELLELIGCVERAGFVPVLTGDALGGERVPDGAVDLILFWKDPLFRRVDSRRAQLHFFEHLRERHGLVGQLGVTTAGMDGPALMGLPTIYLTGMSNVRMREWVGAVPGYREVVREDGYLERIGAILAEWAGA